MFVRYRRFTGASFHEQSDKPSPQKAASTNPFEEPAGPNPFEEDEASPAEGSQMVEKPAIVSPFHGLISRCFENHLNIFVESQDKFVPHKIIQKISGLTEYNVLSCYRNLAELMDRFVTDLKAQGPSLVQAEVEGCTVLPSCADLFVFYKKCLLQCAQLSTGQPMLTLTSVFKKYLREYAARLLQSNLPR